MRVFAHQAPSRVGRFLHCSTDAAGVVLSIWLRQRQRSDGRSGSKMVVYAVLAPPPPPHTHTHPHHPTGAADHPAAHATHKQPAPITQYGCCCRPPAQQHRENSPRDTVVHSTVNRAQPASVSPDQSPAGPHQPCWEAPAPASAAAASACCQARSSLPNVTWLNCCRFN